VLTKILTPKSFILLLWLLSQLAYGAVATIHPAADQPQSYLPLLMGKRVAVFANQTSKVGQKHLIDVLLENHIEVVKIFTPEHGFRGDVDEFVKNSKDMRTGLPIISLYGKKLKPSAADLRDVDIILFDIQDVGVRFYTYISSLQKLMEAALQYHKPLIILDRPNPNGFYIDGPVLEPRYQSFTGMQPVPLVYGMTIGEYAKMLVGEEWLNVKPKARAKKLKLVVVPCVNYTHQSLYELPVKPSPNLPNMQSIYFYPAIGLMEATVMSVGRGTDKPFQVYGHPHLPLAFHFTPRAKPYAKYPDYRNTVCYGWDLSGSKEAVLKEINSQLQIKYLIQAYQLYPNKKHFFAGFSASAGTHKLEQQIKAGMDAAQIRASWQPALRKFKLIRQKYLIYADK
jgi:uncharacterized protein YbbC (DUF1343 family)